MILIHTEWLVFPDDDDSLAGAGSEGRQTALFSLVVALTRRLRAVFVPYFRYLMDAVVVHLGGDAAGGNSAEKPKKKKKRPMLDADPGKGAPADGPLVRFRVWHVPCIKASDLLRYCLQHDFAEALFMAFGAEQLHLQSTLASAHKFPSLAIPLCLTYLFIFSCFQLLA